MGLIEPRPSRIELAERRGEKISDSQRKAARRLFGNTAIGFSLMGDQAHSIFVYDREDRSVGRPASVSLDKSDNVAIVQLTFEHSMSVDSSPLKVVIQKGAFYNCEEATLFVPNLLNEAPPGVRRNRKQADGSNTVPNFMSEVAVIACKRAGSHLMVPVTLDIHGHRIQTELLLDTGASRTLIPTAIYTQKNGKPMTSLSTREVQIVGGVTTVHIDRVGITTTAYSRETNVFISDTDRGLLGIDFFEGTIFTVDVQNESIYLHREN